MNYVIRVEMFGENGPVELGCIGAIKYKFIERTKQNPKLAYNEDGTFKDMYVIEDLEHAKIYKSKNKLQDDLKLLNNSFSGMGMHFVGIKITDEITEKIRNRRRYNN